MVNSSCELDTDCYNIPLGCRPVSLYCYSPKIEKKDRPCGFAKKGNLKFGDTDLNVFYCNRSERGKENPLVNELELEIMEE